MKSKLRRNSLIISLVVAIFIALIYWKEGFVNFENKSMDWRFKLRGVQEPKSPVVIVAIDDESLGRIGKWPWRRNTHAKLVNFLRKAGAGAIVFDVLFYEPDLEHPADDLGYARAMKKSRRTVSSFSFDFLSEKIM